MGSLWRWLTDPRIGDRLLRDEDEDIVDVVHKHPVVYIVPALLGLAGLICWIVVPFSSVELGWAPILVGLVLMLWGALQGAATQHRPVRGHQPARLPGARPAQPQGGHDAAEPDPRHLRGQAVAGPDAELRPLHLRVRRPGAGPARHPLRRTAGRAQPDDPAGRAARGPAGAEPAAGPRRARSRDPRLPGGRPGSRRGGRRRRSGRRRPRPLVGPPRGSRPRGST